MDKHYDIFIRDMKDWMASVEHNISECYGDADKINKLFQSSKKDSEYSKAAQRVLVYMADINRDFSDKLKDICDLDIVYRTEVDELNDKIKELRLNNTKIVEQLKMIQLYDNSKIAENMYKIAESFNELVKSLNSQQAEISRELAESESIKTLSSEIKRVLSLFEDNMSSVVVSEKMKQSPGRRFDNTKEYLIKSNYVTGMKPVELQRKMEQQGHKVSLPTIIKRYDIEGWVR